MSELHPLPGCRIQHVERISRSGLEITAVGTQAEARCPGCGFLSTSSCGSYLRRPADLPSVGRVVLLVLRVRRFMCGNAACARRTFAEPLDALVAPRARRTDRLASAQGRVALTAGGEAGARLLNCLGMPTSPDTLLRLVRRMPLAPPSEPRAVGVDDWALRKGQTYGTILVDLERRRPLDLLPGRTADALAAWLRRHAKVRIITRDRSTEYARGALEGAPQALQVADRWHLLQNMRQVAERWFAGAHARLRRLPALPEPPVPQSQPREAFPRSQRDAAVGVKSRARRLSLYEEIQRRHGAGEPLLTISRHMGLARGTVRAYAQSESFPERALPRPRPSILDPHLAYLGQRLVQGCENALLLWRELQARGFHGTRRQVTRWLQTRRTVASPFCSRHVCHGTLPAELSPAQITMTNLPSAQSLAWMAMKGTAALLPDEAAAIGRVTQDQEAATMVALVRRFADLVRGRSITAKQPCHAPVRTFRCWLQEASASGLRSMATFATGLRKDAAVQAALTTRWSNAQCEGHITRLKLLKRQMYGRADLDLLRRRLLLAT